MRWECIGADLWKCSTSKVGTLLPLNLMCNFRWITWSLPEIKASACVCVVSVNRTSDCVCVIVVLYVAPSAVCLSSPLLPPSHRFKTQNYLKNSWDFLQNSEQQKIKQTIWNMHIWRTAPPPTHNVLGHQQGCWCQKKKLSQHSMGKQKRKRAISKKKQNVLLKVREQSLCCKCHSINMWWPIRLLPWWCVGRLSFSHLMLSFLDHK